MELPRGLLRDGDRGGDKGAFPWGGDSEHGLGEGGSAPPLANMSPCTGDAGNCAASSAANEEGAAALTSLNGCCVKSPATESRAGEAGSRVCRGEDAGGCPER